MSSMRNAVQRRNHKERAQPIERERKWGLLEKRSDYKLRAADHRKKQAKLKLLKEKAALRNPDEFSFSMLNSKVDKHGRKIADRGNRALSTDVVKLLKTQDAGYIRTMLQMVRKEREELEQRMILEDEEVGVRGRTLRDEGKSSKHTVYVGGSDEQKDFDHEAWFGKGQEWPDKHAEEGTARYHNEDEDEDEDRKRGIEETQLKKLSKKQQEAAWLAEKEKRTLMSKRERTQQRAAVHLDAIRKRERDLMAAAEELDNQRAKMNNTIGGTNKHGVKFKIRERKR